MDINRRHGTFIIVIFFVFLAVYFNIEFFLNKVTAPSTYEIQRMLNEEADKLVMTENILEQKRVFIDRGTFWTLIVQYQGLTNLEKEKIIRHIKDNNYLYKGKRLVPNQEEAYFFEKEDFYTYLLWKSNDTFAIEYCYKNFSDRKKGVTF